jgi:hypothetical protein
VRDNEGFQGDAQSRLGTQHLQAVLLKYGELYAPQGD